MGRKLPNFSPAMKLGQILPKVTILVMNFTSLREFGKSREDNVLLSVLF